MGCCTSSTARTDPKAPAQQHHHCPPPNRSHSPPPPPSVEEETVVKEVLSETPIIPKPPLTAAVIPLLPIPNHKTTQVQQTKETKPPTFTNKRKEEEEAERTPKFSQASEICSISDTYSTATTASTTTTTTTVTEIREADEVTSKNRVNRSPSKLLRKRPYTGDRQRPPMVKSQLSGHARTSTTTTKQHNVGSSRVGRDLGERPGCHSRSPTASAGGTPAVKVNGKPVGKPAERELRKEEESKSDNGLMQQQQQQQGNESLDNPLVSMECFIFL